MPHHPSPRALGTPVLATAKHLPAGVSPVRRRALCFGAAAWALPALAPWAWCGPRAWATDCASSCRCLRARGADGAIRAISNSLAKALGQP